MTNDSDGDAQGELETLDASGPVLPWEALGAVLSMAVLGFTLYFSVGINDAGGLILSDEIVQFADNKLTAILLLFAGVGVGSLVSTYSRHKGSVSGGGKWSAMEIVTLVIDAAVIVTAIVFAAIATLTMMLVFWFVAMIGFLVVPGLIKVHRGNSGGWVLVRKIDR